MARAVAMPHNTSQEGASHGDWSKTFDWKVGAKLEAFTDQDWWEVVVVQLERDRALIHYVGGGEDEDEWIMKSNSRLRPPQSSTKVSTSSAKTTTISDSQTENKSAADASMDEGSQRPVRRSRMLSDDARLALQLQEEELRSSRGLKAAARKRSLPQDKADSAKKVAKVAATSSITTPAQSQTSKNFSSATGSSMDSKQVLPSRKHSAGATGTEDRNMQKNSIKSKAPPTSSKTSTSTKTKSKDKASFVDKEGTVSFTAIPDESGSDPLPTLQRSRMSWSEDVTVFHVKRQIVEEVCPEIGASQIDIRTPSGILLGQDHSLKFVRTILWPPSKGELILKYSRGKTLML